MLLVVGVVGLFMFGKAGQRRDKPTTAEDAGGPKGMTLIGEDFDYTFTDGARPVFHIKGESIKADREGTIYLDRVGVTLWDRQGRIFHLESRKASFNRESNEGQLQGNVVVRGPNELELRTARLNLQQKGDVVISDDAGRDPLWRQVRRARRPDEHRHPRRGVHAAGRGPHRQRPRRAAAGRRSTRSG